MSLGVALVTWVVFYVRCLLPAAPSPAEARQPKVRDPQNFASSNLCKSKFSRGGVEQFPFCRGGRRIASPKTSKRPRVVDLPREQ